MKRQSKPENVFWYDRECMIVKINIVTMIIIAYFYIYIHFFNVCICLLKEGKSRKEEGKRDTDRHRVKRESRYLSR